MSGGPAPVPVLRRPVVGGLLVTAAVLVGTGDGLHLAAEVRTVEQLASALSRQGAHGLPVRVVVGLAVGQAAPLVGFLLGGLLLLLRGWDAGGAAAGLGGLAGLALRLPQLLPSRLPDPDLGDPVGSGLADAGLLVGAVAVLLALPAVIRTAPGRRSRAQVVLVTGAGGLLALLGVLAAVLGGTPGGAVCVLFLLLGGGLVLGARRGVGVRASAGVVAATLLVPRVADLGLDPQGGADGVAVLLVVALPGLLLLAAALVRRPAPASVPRIVPAGPADGPAGGPAPTVREQGESTVRP